MDLIKKPIDFKPISPSMIKSRHRSFSTADVSYQNENTRRRFNIIIMIISLEHFEQLRKKFKRDCT